ncbi:MAG: ion channel [Myxococcota bacterium]
MAEDPHRSSPPPPRYRNGQLIYNATGLSYRWLGDLYHLFIRTSWGVLLGVSIGGYVGTNFFFALLYLLGGDCIDGAQPGDLTDAFWFSVQTLSTIGYGRMSPSTFYSNVLATIESYVGLVSVAMGTGLLFAKFSRPTARVGFSKMMVIHPRNGVPCLMFRMANERRNQVVEARLHVSVLRDETTMEGDRIRRFHTMRLERSASPVFALTWTAIHPLDETSPLYGLTADNVAAEVAAIVVTFTGIDDTFAQSIHARTVYLADQIAFNHRFVDILDRDEHGTLTIHHERLDAVEPLPAAISRRTPVAPSSGS